MRPHYWFRLDLHANWSFVEGWDVATRVAPHKLRDTMLGAVEIKGRELIGPVTVV
jgi:hypothetical protein